MASETLSSVQLHALYDILTHHQSYKEVAALKLTNTITNFGLPLQEKSTGTPSSPLIQILLKRFVLIFPGLRDVSPTFWHQRIEPLFAALAGSDLSESYDKGSIGTRKTLATAGAAMVEYCARGSLGGYPKREVNGDRDYDATNPDDVYQAWNDFLQQIVYGDGFDKMFEKVATTDQLTDHEPLVQATHEYVFVILASFLHYVLIVSPRGQSILPLLARANWMMPWRTIRGFLKMGNAASMLNAMISLLLAKMNATMVTQWFGAAKSDRGMNLMQQIISTVLGWDNSELKKRAAAVEKDKNAPSKDKLEVLKHHCEKSADEHQQCRIESESQSKSIVVIILSKSSVSATLTDTQHELALEYLALHLSIRDRQELINVLCHHQPDLLTSSVQDLVDVYDPILRALHNSVDLSGGTSDLQAFLHDLLEVSKLSSKAKDAKPLTVEDFVRLLKKHQGSSHRFLHQAVKNGKELREWYCGYAKHAAAQYQQKTDNPSTLTEDGVAGAGDLTPDLQDIASKLSTKDRQKVIKELDSHAKYLSSLSQASEKRMKTVVRNAAEEKSETLHGPGMFLEKWQALMDDTAITPATAEGPVRHGSSESVQEATKVDVDGSKKGGDVSLADEKAEAFKRPDVDHTVKVLGPSFREILIRIANEG